MDLQSAPRVLREHYEGTIPLEAANGQKDNAGAHAHIDGAPRRLLLLVVPFERAKAGRRYDIEGVRTVHAGLAAAEWLRDGQEAAVSGQVITKAIEQRGSGTRLADEVVHGHEFGDHAVAADLLLAGLDAHVDKHIERVDVSSRSEPSSECCA